MKKKLMVIIGIILVLITGGVATYVGLANDDREVSKEHNQTIETVVQADTKEDITTEVLTTETDKEVQTEDVTTEEVTVTTEQNPTGTSQSKEKDKDDKPSSETYTATQDTAQTTTETQITTEETTETVTQTTETQATTEATTETEKVWVDAVYEEVWVVDQEAYTIENPIYETVCLSICNGCGADITGNTDAHMKSQMISGNLACGGYHTEYVQVQVGTEIIEVPEEGHWETVLISEGYWM